MSAKVRRNEILPASLPPFGVGREKAAALIEISVSLFDRLVEAGKMPQPRQAEGRLVWDVAELAEAFRALPHRAGNGIAVLSAVDIPWG